MEIKILCGCGAKFAFGIEPDNGRMPFPVNCPECSADITTRADEIIAAQLPPIPVAMPIVHPVSAVPVQMPSSLQTRLPAVFAQPTPPRKPAATGNPPSGSDLGGSIAGAVEESGGEEVVPKPKKKKRRKKKVQRPKGGANVLTGVIGGMVGAAIGAGIWFCLARYAGLNLGIIAWLVGGLVGFGSKIGAGEDSDLVAIFAGGMALGAILGGQFMAINGLIMADRGMADLDLVYEMHQEMAKEVVAAEDDRELTRVLMDWYDEDYNPAEIKEYKQKDLPFMRKMATGNATKKEFQQFMTARLDPWDEFKTSFGIKMYIWIFFGIGTAYRIPGGGTED